MIEVENLTKRYGPTLAVDDLSFVAPPGTVTGFLGPNGAGKSTTMRMIAGLDAHRRRRVVNAGIVSLCGGSILSGNTASNPRRTSNFSGSSPVACPSPTRLGSNAGGTSTTYLLGHQGRQRCLPDTALAAHVRHGDTIFGRGC